MNFTQTFEKSQKVKCELDALPSAEGEGDENKGKRQKETDLEKRVFILSFTKIKH